VIDHHGGISEVSAGRHVASRESECEGVSTARTGGEKVHVLLAQCCIDGLNNGQAGRAELATTHRLTRG